MNEEAERRLEKLIHAAIIVERQRIGMMLTLFAMSIVEDKTKLAEQSGVTQEQKETAQLAVGTFAATFVQRLAEEPLPIICVRCIEGTHGKEEVVH